MSNTVTTTVAFGQAASTEELMRRQSSVSALVENGSGFGLTLQELSALVTPFKDHSKLSQLGGAIGILSKLRVDEANGLSIVNDKDLNARREAFGANVLPAVKPKSLFEYMISALSDKIMILLSVVSFISLSIGIYEDVHEPDPAQRVHWIEGFSVLVAVIIVVMASSINDLQKEKQFRKLNAKKEDRKVKGIRDAKTQLISVYDILVGDVLLLEPGDVIAADGVFISGMGLKCDESSATGETDAIRKGVGHDCLLVSGSKVTEGIGKYVVTGVGEHSFFGAIMMAMRTENEDTPLQVKLDGLAEQIAKLGTAFALLLFILLFLKYIITVLKTNGFGDGEHQESGPEVASQLVNILLVSIAIVAVAVPEGLPLAVTLALAYATTRMMKDNNLVRVLSACETMGNATTICSDKTGTLTQNRMTVVTGVVGKNAISNNNQGISKQPGPVASVILEKIMEGVAINSSAFEGVDDTTGKASLIGSKTEIALLEWATHSGFDFKQIRSSNETLQVIQVYPFSSERKSMATLVKVTKPGMLPVYRMHVKGAPEIRSLGAIPALGSRSNPHSSLIYPLDEKLKSDYTGIIESFALQSLRTICVAYREFTGEEFDTLVNAGQKLTLASIVGIEDPLRPGVIEAVKACQDAGVFVRMVTGDNIMTAKSIATKCGIYQRGGLVMEGEYFRGLSEERMLELIPKLQVLARSSPLDKQILVSKLKLLGETVAVTGDGTNDGPALKMADIGFIAKEASSIILMDDSFSSVVKAILWGRSVNDAVKKFLQFQLSVNISAVLITLISALVDSNESSALTVVQLLWVNLIMDTLAALALATELPTNELLQRPPEAKKAPLITFAMWKMIIGQAFLQIVVNLVLLFAGAYLLGFRELIDAGGIWGTDDGTKPKVTEQKLVLKTIVFNSFVILQLFSLINSRRIDNHLNVFKGILQNPPFFIIFVIIVFSQAIIVEYGGVVFQTHSLSGLQWLVCIIAGSLSVPWGMIIRLGLIATQIPNNIFQCFGFDTEEKTAHHVILEEYHAISMGSNDEFVIADQSPHVYNPHKPSHRPSNHHLRRNNTHHGAYQLRRNTAEAGSIESTISELPVFKERRQTHHDLNHKSSASKIGHYSFLRGDKRGRDGAETGSGSNLGTANVHPSLAAITGQTSKGAH
ncbi:calcium-translocating P-type ATPase [Rhizoclosmatium globosum]|uniref:Calcium-transporting ATPase n=1 Tax=Rhizoclosmatium globosum TaxID=329046 RepID=A0A1Y2D1B5_9FUNG|nr:calcium-translocating P-type ATPase [Rhizoclosmatium globosum]|eukprot:ORY52395.1 calcium-translocating P-type ATPase [Rhizoclosmatium globosum]